MQKLKVGDKIKVRSGKDKGREGKIEKIYPKEGRAVVFGINIFKKHVKAQAGRQGQKSGIYDIPRPLPFSKVSLVCPKCGKETRVKIKVLADSKKRICQKCSKEIDSK